MSFQFPHIKRNLCVSHKEKQSWQIGLHLDANPLVLYIDNFIDKG